MNETQTYTGPLFIIGMPRSGTKLLRNLLNRHDRIAIPDVETEFLPWLAHHADGFGDLEQFLNFERLFAHVTKMSFFTYRREEGRCPTGLQWHQACQRYDSAGLFEAIIRLDVRVSSDLDVIWGDKSPSYIRHIPLIAVIYPEARFIHIVRDVRDYSLSINNAWGKNMLRAAQRWADDVEAASRALQALPNPHLLVRYEDLLTDTESVLKQVYGLLGIDFDPEMLRLDKPSENRGDARGQTRIVAENLGKYRRGMPEDTLRRIEEIAGEVLKTHSYTLDMPNVQPRRLGKYEMRMAQIRDGWNLIRSSRMERGGLLAGIVFPPPLFHDDEKDLMTLDAIHVYRRLVDRRRSLPARLILRVLLTDWFSMLDKLYLRMLQKSFKRFADRLSRIHYALNRLVPTSNRLALYLSGTVVTCITK